MTIRLSTRLVSILILVLLAVLALTMVLLATPEGLTLSDDSIAYIAGARSMLAGNGYREAWLASNGPVTHFPPAYPAALAVLGWAGLDPVRGARFLGAVLFALSTGLLGILGWRMTRSLPAGIALAALFVLNASLLRLHAAALSEPLFLFFSLLSFWMFDLYHERDAHWLWLVACSAFVGLAYLTRYAALALAITFVIGLLVLHQSWRKRLISVGIFAFGLLPWIAGWAIRNSSVGGTTTNRTLVWHPITGANFDTALRSISGFLVPVEAWRQALFRVPGLFMFLVLAILAAVLCYVLIRIRRKQASPEGSGGEVLSLLNAIFIYGYLASISFSMTLFDASTKFRLRILSPVYVALFVLLVALGVWAWRKRRGLVLGVALLIFAGSLYGLRETMGDLMRGGQGYASFRWYDSQAMAFLRDLPRDVMIYTNEPGAVYLYTGMPGYVLPDQVDPVTAAARPGFEQGLVQLQADVRSGKAVLALFSGGDSPAEDSAQLSSGLDLVHKSGGAEIYGATP
jgi:4-amino-4-deoxy-L-arabinose transferase-like glycosyltransferase